MKSKWYARIRDSRISRTSVISNKFLRSRPVGDKRGLLYLFCQSVHMSVCSSVDALKRYFARTRSRMSLSGFRFHWAYGSNILELCLCGLYLDFLKKANFKKKNVAFLISLLIIHTDAPYILSLIRWIPFVYESFIFQFTFLGISILNCCCSGKDLIRRVPHELFPQKAVPHQIPASLEILRKFILAWRF